MIYPPARRAGFVPSIFSRIVVLATVLLSLTNALANHGPGTSGGGSSTVAGETLARGGVELAFRTDHTDFEHVSRAQAERLAGRSGDHGHYDALNHSYLYNVSVGYSLLDDLTLGAQVGYYYADDFVGAHVHGDGSTGAHTGNVAGVTDLLLTAKYRVLKGPRGHLAILGGVKLPTGKDDAELTHGDLAEPSSQPGSGAVDYQAGLAYSRFLTDRVTLDASGVYTLRTEDDDDFKVGDRVDLGAAVSYRLTDSVRDFPQLSAFGELLVVWLDKDDNDGEREANSGGTAV